MDQIEQQKRLFYRSMRFKSSRNDQISYLILLSIVKKEIFSSYALCWSRVYLTGILMGIKIKLDGNVLPLISRLSIIQVRVTKWLSLLFKDKFPSLRPSVVELLL